MKFSIRFAYQIIGALIVLAMGMLVFVIFMLGSSQRWFSRDFQYKSYFSSAAGLSTNMPVQYKGFTIGYIKSIRLSEDDQVEVNFTIFDTYNDRVKYGSLVEVQVSPIGALGGSNFMFYSGAGSELVGEGETIPTVSSAEGKRLIALGLTVLPQKDDSLDNIVNQVNTLLATVNGTISDLQEAFSGSTETSLGRTMAGIEAAVYDLPANVEQTLNDISVQLTPVLSNLEEITNVLTDPQGSVMAILDPQGPVYNDLLASLSAISGTLKNLETVSDFIPSQLPALAVLLSDVHTALKTAEDVLVSLTNNPLLKGGIPERTETSAGGMRPRDIQF